MTLSGSSRLLCCRHGADLDVAPSRALMRKVATRINMLNARALHRIVDQLDGLLVVCANNSASTQSSST